MEFFVKGQRQRRVPAIFPGKLATLGCLLLLGYHSAASSGLKFTPTEPVATDPVPKTEVLAPGAERSVEHPSKVEAGLETRVENGVEATEEATPQEAPASPVAARPDSGIGQSAQMQDVMQLRWEQSVGGDHSDCRTDGWPNGCGCERGYLSSWPSRWRLTIDAWHGRPGG